MTQYEIKQQISDIREVTEEATKSKESALKFLRDAGIIKGDNEEQIKQSLSPEPSQC